MAAKGEGPGVNNREGRDLVEEQEEPRSRRGMRKQAQVSSIQDLPKLNMSRAALSKAPFQCLGREAIVGYNST